MAEESEMLKKSLGESLGDVCRDVYALIQEPLVLAGIHTNKG